MPQWMLVASCVLILLLQTTSGYKVAPWRSTPAQPPSAMELKGRVQLRDQSGDDCVATLMPVFEKVALLFLIIDKIPHEAVWTEWLKQLEDMMPASFLCNEKTLNCFEGLMPKTRNSVYDAQPYITLYVHPVPQFPGFPKGSIFYRREIANRIQTAHGHHSLAVAHRLLLIEALKDPLNQRFQLLCPATIPVRPAQFAYEQLLAQKKSRVGNYVWWQRGEGLEENDPETIRTTVPGRFPLPMMEEWPEVLKHASFHRQFITLTRRHAQFIENDTFVFDLFDKHCFKAIEGWGQICISDEQYIGTALSYYLREGVSEELTNDLAMVMGMAGDGYAAGDVSHEFFQQLLGTSANVTLLHEYEDFKALCEAPNSEPQMLLMGREEKATLQASCSGGGGFPREAVTLYWHCPLFARKFKQGTVSQVFRMLEDEDVI